MTDVAMTYLMEYAHLDSTIKLQLKMKLRCSGIFIANLEHVHYINNLDFGNMLMITRKLYRVLSDTSDGTLRENS